MQDSDVTRKSSAFEWRSGVGVRRRGEAVEEASDVRLEYLRFNGADLGIT